MNNKQQNPKYFLWLSVLFVFLTSLEVKAQTVSTYFGFNTNEQNPKSLLIDPDHNFYVVDYDVNWRPQIKKITAEGSITIHLPSGNFNIQNLIIDNSGNLYFTDDYNNWSAEIKKVTPDGTVSTFVPSGNYNPQNLTFDNSGNLYFKDDNSWPAEIIKVTPDGTMSTFVPSGNYNPREFVLDSADNLYFADDYNWPPEIMKVTPDGTISTFVPPGNYNPQNLTFDNSGNLYFTDDNNNWPPEIKKVTPDGTVSTFVPSNNFDPRYLTFDTTGNLFFVDIYNWPREIKKVTPAGVLSTYVNAGINNLNDLTIDETGNLYFIDNNGSYKINIIIKPGSSCITPAALVINDTVVCTGGSVGLYASGIGDLQWFDQPTGGNLLAAGNNYVTPALTDNTTYYVESIYCNETSPRKAITVSTNSTPTAIISGTLTGNDFVALTASGGVSYLWSGGYSNSLPNNIFNNSGTYTVTVTNAFGCSDLASATITVNKFGLDKYGSLVNDSSLRLNNNGSINAPSYVNKHGQNFSSIPTDGNLNYAVFTNASGYAYSAADFIGYTRPGNQTNAGINACSTLLDWNTWTVLNTAGISIPNSGERFALVVSGYFIPEESGIYTFTCEGDDAVDLFINEINVANHYGAHGTEALGTHTGTINLEVGVRYTFRARMQENGGGDGLKVFWRKPSEVSGWNINSSEITSN